MYYCAVHLLFAGLAIKMCIKSQVCVVNVGRVNVGGARTIMKESTYQTVL